MPIEAWITLVILGVMFVLLIQGKLPAWLIFMGTLAVLMTLKLAPEDALLKGFSNSGVITVGVLFVVAAGMYSTGAITLVADKLIGLPKTLRKAQLKILPPVAIGSAFLNNTPLVAMMVPVIRDLTRVAGLPGTYLYMPLSFSSILGGASTLIGTSTNLIIAGLVLEQISRGGANGLRSINIFDPTLVGLPAAIVGIAFMIFVGKRLLPAPQAKSQTEEIKRLYKAEFIVQTGTSLVGKSIQDAGLAQAEGYRLISLQRKGIEIGEAEKIEVEEKPTEEALDIVEETKPKRKKGLMHRMKGAVKRIGKIIPTPKLGVPKKPELDPLELLQAGDLLTFVCDVDALPALWATIGLEPRFRGGLKSSRYTHYLAEVVVSASNRALGKPIANVEEGGDSIYQTNVIALSRNAKAPDITLNDVSIEIGDVFVLEVEEDFFYHTRNEIEFSLVRRLHGYRIQRTSRATIALVITLMMILLAAFNVMSMLNAALLAVGAMLITGCLSIKVAWRSVEWQTLVILGAAIGLESAVTASGLSEYIANGLSAIGGDNPYIALAVVFLGAVFMTNVITNAAAAAFMFPIAMSMAGTLGVNAMPFVIVLMMATSYAFINPAGYQTNLMVQRPAGYSFGNFVKLGLPVTLMAGIVVLIVAPLVYPF